MKSTASRALKTTCMCAAAVALAGGATLARAQSSVQLYGQVDEWIGAQKFPGGQRAWGVQGGGMSTSYWGIRGTEDLGGGYQAIFTLEDFFRAQTGRYGRFDGDTFFGRNAYVGLATPYGTVTAGRLTTHLFVSTILFNPFIDSYVFSPMVYHVFLGLGTFPTYTTDQGVVGDSGWNNAVGYTSPSFGGLSGGVMYAFGNSAGENRSKKWSGQLNYANGPFAATAVYQYVNFNNDPGDLGALVSRMKSQGVAQVGLSYDFKLVKLYGQYMYTHNEQDTGSWHVNTVQGGVAVPLGAGRALASYAYSHGSGGLEQTHRTWAVGYDYPLSKRTDLYTAYMNDRFSGMGSGDTFGAGIRAKF
ncbi:porin [Burkholderia sp. TSV86]|uniref:porin n=1 Tax=Burkholderia sp. TSV86 TaxID=1385594 RepID=UPI0007581471|nr:porin [Burkholderia sp. TSV86]KVE33259.1 porin [Burkholderia sp. TSV86]